MPQSPQDQKAEAKRLRMNAATRRYAKSVKGMAYFKSWNSRNKEKKLQYQRDTRAKNRAIIAAAKNKPCMDCGQRFRLCAMDFDHRDASQKSFGFGEGNILKSERIIAEIAKCDVVCANCHRIREDDRRQKKSQAVA